MTRRPGSRVFHPGYGLGNVQRTVSANYGAVNVVVAFDMFNEEIMVSDLDLFDALPKRPKLTIIDGGLTA